MSPEMKMVCLCVVEGLLWWVATFLFFWKGHNKKFPAMGGFFLTRSVASPALTFFYYGSLYQWFHGESCGYYFVVFWMAYLICAVFVYFICAEIFRAAMANYSGLAKMGMIIFRWVALVAGLICISNASIHNVDMPRLYWIGYGMMHAVSILELCLLGFITFSMKALKISVHDIAFGIALGFGVLATCDFTIASLITKYTVETDAFQFVGEFITFAAIGVWSVYSLLPQRQREKLSITTDSTVYRWNEIAAVLGEPTSQVAQHEPEGFFLSDVERLVEKVIARNMEQQPADKS